MSGAGISVGPRERPWPDRSLGTGESLVGFLQFLHDTAVNKVSGLDDEQARATPLATSPAMSPLGLVQHLTAVYRQHLRIHLAGRDLPPLLHHGDTEQDFRLATGATRSGVLEAFDDEWRAARTELAGIDLESFVTSYGRPVRAGRLLVDVVQEVARHVGHLDVLRELIDGTRGE